MRIAFSTSKVFHFIHVKPMYSLALVFEWSNIVDIAYLPLYKKTKTKQNIGEGLVCDPGGMFKCGLPNINSPNYAQGFLSPLSLPSLFQRRITKNTSFRQ